MALRGVPLTLGDREWTLRCTLGAMAAIEDHGTSWRETLAKLQGKDLSLRAVQLLVWAMLQGHNGDSPTLAQVGDWVDPENLPTVLDAVGSALRAAFPPEKPGGERPPTGRGTGTRSSAPPTARSGSPRTPSTA